MLGVAIILVIILSIHVGPALSTSSCMWPPCRWELERDENYHSKIVVEDSSNHSIAWSWSVPQGGYWSITYRYTAYNKIYSGEMRFMNATNELDAVITWGSAKNWSSNAVKIFAESWNITYNGDMFGFQPTRNGMYTVHVYTKNKQHNPFANYYTEQPCSISTTDASLIKSWWASKKLASECQRISFNWFWESPTSSWNVLYESTMDASTVNCSVHYQNNELNEKVNLINWLIDANTDTVFYKAAKDGGMQGQPAWTMNLNPKETWGFAPTDDQGNWVFNHYSLGIVFRPFTDMEKEATPQEQIK